MINRVREYLIELNKERLIILSSVILLILGINLHNGKDIKLFNFMKHNVIVVDAGHGGIDGGAGKKYDVLEKDINLQVSKKLKKELIVEGFKVIMMREEDISLEDFSQIEGSRYRRDLDARKSIINNSSPLVFISIHCNSSQRSTAKGIKIYHYPNSTEGEKLARYISQSVDEHLYKDYMKQEYMRAEVLSEDFYILRETDYVGVLVEIGFLTNPEEKMLLQEEEYQRQIARAIKKGILKYLE